MKRILIAMVLILDVAFGANAESEIVDGVTWYYETFSDGGVTCARIIPGSDVYKGDLTIPSFIGGYPVREIRVGAFYCCSELSSSIIPEGVTSIGDYAFYLCSGLKSVSIPSTVRGIWGSAFCGCSRLTSVTIPWGVTHIGDWAFSACSRLTSMSIPGSVMSIGEHAFSDCNELTSVTISEGVLSIGKYAFLGCSKLTSISIPSSVTSVGDLAFLKCDRLSQIVVAAGNTSYRVESNCLVTMDGMMLVAVMFGYDVVHIPAGVMSIPYHMFDSDVNLKAVAMPSSVRTIDEGAFKGCDNLASVTIPEGVSIVGNYAFEDCSRLKSVTIPSSVIGIYYRAFSGCSSLTSIFVSNDGDIDAVKKMLNEAGVNVGRLTFDHVISPTIEGDEDATVTGDAETGFVIKPSEGKTAVEVTIPQGVDAAKVTVEVSPKVASVKPNGAKVKIVSGGADITGFLNMPAADGNGVVDLTKATVKEEIVKESMDPEKGAEIKLNAANPTLITPNTRVGLFYQLREGTTLEGMSNGDSTIGDGNPWKPEIKVKGGNSAFYSIGVGKGE